VVFGFTGGEGEELGAEADDDGGFVAWMGQLEDGPSKGITHVDMGGKFGFAAAAAAAVGTREGRAAV
jgi:hypothetical protein